MRIWIGSVIRESLFRRSPHGAKRNAGRGIPDCAALHPGCETTTGHSRKTPLRNPPQVDCHRQNDIPTWTHARALLQSFRPRGNLLPARTLMTYAIVVPFLVAAHTASARAEIRVEGSASNVHVGVRDAPVADVLAALAH